MCKHEFKGVWITDSVFCSLEPRNVFHRQLEPIELLPDPYQNSHVLFRKKFYLDSKDKKAKVYISADDYYKLYVNGKFVGQGPAPEYNMFYNYNEIDLSEYLVEGENVIAVHTYYQGLINRVWQSGDFRHGLILDLDVDGKNVVKSDETFLTARHSAYTAVGVYGYDTQFVENYNSNARECFFYLKDFDDSYWQNASIKKFVDYNLYPQQTKMLEFEKINPVNETKTEDSILFDFGANYVGYLYLKVKGNSGETVIVKQGQELNDDGSVKASMRCRCYYQEEWILSGETDELDQFDYKAFRYVELVLPKGAKVIDCILIAKHYPFKLNAKVKEQYKNDKLINQIWNLCVNSQKYGVQETIQDCMDREKGFYLGDGCYSALANYLLSGDDKMARKLIDDAFRSSFITEGLVTCIDCSFMQEIAEYPLILVDFILWHYRISGDKNYLAQNYKKLIPVLNFYKDNYEKDFLLRDLDRWCIVEWPDNFQDGYAVDILEGKVCHEPHVAINAYYINSIRTLNKIAKELNEKPYRDEQPLKDAFIKAFYDKEQNLYVDGTEHRHVSLVGNIFPYAFNIIPDDNFVNEFKKLIDEKGYEKTSFFSSIWALIGFLRDGEEKRIYDFISHEGTWKRMLSEGATTTFEGWGKDVKWNTSLFHLTMTYVSVFIADVDIKKILL